jgi:hypothetical protein
MTFGTVIFEGKADPVTTVNSLPDGGPIRHRKKGIFKNAGDRLERRSEIEWLKIHQDIEM